MTMISSQASKQKQTISLAQRDLIDRFIASFNQIEHHLSHLLGNQKYGFKATVRKCLELGHLRSFEAQALIKVSNLRNVLVHEPLQARQYPAIPTVFTVDALEALRNSLLKPERVLPRYEKEVEVISIDHPLSNVLRTISLRDYSQFPVYDDQTFKGLLTENGITRWMAHHISSNGAWTDLDQACVRQALREEEHKRRNFRFISRETTITQLRFLFAKHELLEAALITQHGKNSESLLGIVTRWDIVQLT